jgi:molybdate transport system ATP-binding protein
MLSVDIEKRLGDVAIRANFEASDGVTALFGPSGSGKTSIVNMVAGLMTPDRGRIEVNGTLLFDSASRFSHRTGAASATCFRTAACSRT